MSCSMMWSFRFSLNRLAKRKTPPMLRIGLMSQSLLLVVFFTVPGATWAQPTQSGGWISDQETSCKVWNPNPQGGETIKWSGPCINGLAQGRGSLQWFKDNRLLEQDDGEWQDGRQTGAGTQVWQGGRYEGQPDGHGVWTLPTGRYDGEFRNGKPNGKGKLSNANGVFEGTWKNGCFRDGTRKAYVGVPSTACP
jgi:hypothetical protein